MQAALRSLSSEGPASSSKPAPILLLQDHGVAADSCMVMQHVLQQAAALLLERQMGCSMVAVDPGVLSPGHTSPWDIVPGTEDPWGWNSSTCSQPGSQPAASGTQQCWEEFVASVDQHIGNQDPSEEHSQQAAGSHARQQTVWLAIDSLSTLVACYSISSVLEWLHKLQMHPQIAGIIGIMHTEMLLDHAVITLAANAAAVMSVLSQPSGKADGNLTTWLRRRNGCARVTTENFQVLPDQTVLISKAVKEAAGPVLESKPTTDARQNTISNPVPGQQPHRAASMKHELSQAEREARQAVVLPFEKMQRADGGSQKQTGISEPGRIHYIRDSDNDADSDEDPDDDLDI